MDKAPETSLDAVGVRLRSLRAQRHATLAGVAAETGISVSTLSRLESGQRRPTLELLMPLARAYGVTLDELVDAPPTGDPRVHMRPLRRHGATVIPLTERAGGVRAYKYILPAAPPTAEPALQTHEGYEWLYVLSGSLRLVLGTQELVLLPGEAAEFNTRTPHWMGNAAPEETAAGIIAVSDGFALRMLYDPGRSAQLEAALTPLITQLLA